MRRLLRNALKYLLAIRQVLWNVLKYLLAISLLSYMVWKYWSDTPQGPGLGHVWQKHVVEREPIQAGFLILAFLVGIIAVLLTFVRWYSLVRAQDLPCTLYNAVRLCMVGMFFNTFLPGSVGGDIVKAAFIARQQSRRTVAVATVIMDRAIALWGLVWFVALLGVVFWASGLVQSQAEKSIVLIFLGILGLTGLVWILLGILPPRRAEIFAGRLSRIPKVGHSAAEFWRAVWIYRQRPASVGLAMLIALVGHVGFVLVFYFSAQTLADAGDAGQSIPTWWQHFLIVPIGMFIQAIPLFPGGAGIGEAGFGSLYGLLGCSVASGVLGSLVQRVIFWALGLVCYVAYLRMRPAIREVTVPPTELAVAEA